MPIMMYANAEIISRTKPVSWSHDCKKWRVIWNAGTRQLRDYKWPMYNKPWVGTSWSKEDATPPYSTGVGWGFPLELELRELSWSEAVDSFVAGRAASPANPSSVHMGRRGG